MARDLLGEFEQMVLLAVLRLGEDAYGVPIIEEIEQRTGRRPADAAVYIVLRRLEQKEYLDSHLDGASETRGGRRRRYFRLRTVGLEALRHSRRRLLGLWEGLEDVLE